MLTQINNKDSSARKEQNQRRQGQRNRADHTDSFTKYSDDATRLKKLLLKEHDEEFDLEDFASTHYGTDKVNLNCTNKHRQNQKVEQDVTRRLVDDCNPQEASYARKTRISFEVHPSLLFEDSELYGASDADGLDRLEDLLDDADDNSDIESLIAALGLAH